MQVCTRIVLFHFLIVSSVANSQNLVPNPSFEDATGCPQSVAQIQLAAPWVSANSASPDYLHVCGQPMVSVPLNVFGYQEPHTGDAYAGEVFRFLSPPNYREYIMTPLSQPMLPGMPYYVEFWVSLAGTHSCPNSEFGAYFSAIPPIGGSGILGVIPQFKPEPGFILDTVNWVSLSGCVIAEGGEQYMTIGNFSSFEDTPIYPDCPMTYPDGISYYFIDDVSLLLPSTETLAIELGDTITSCAEIILNPNIPNVNYYWSIGSTDPSIVVSSTGMYAVTISQNCEIGTDSVYIIIPSSQQVDLGGDTVNICMGEIYQLELDQHFEYTWSNGSNSYNPIFEDSGLYQVTMNDGCSISYDSFFLQFIVPPPPFQIVDDSVLCNDQEFFVYFDPSIGEFLWQDGSTDSDYYILQPGIYALTISNQCGTEIASVEIMGMETPEVAIGTDTILCVGESYNISLPFDNMTHSFIWSDGSTAASLLIDSEGMYSVTVTNSCGESSDTINVAMLIPPFVSLGEDITVCSLDNGILLSAGDIPNANYSWQDNSSDPTYTVYSAGTYSVMIENVCGTAADTIQIDEYISITPPSLGPDVTICPGDQLVLAVSSPGDFIQWSDMSTLDTFYVTAPGVYAVQVFNNCESYSDTIIVSVSNEPPSVDLPDQLNLCSGQSLVIDPMINGVSYAWSTGSDQPTLMIDAPGSYALTVSNTCGAAADTVIVVDGGVAPLVSLGQDTAICSGAGWLLQPQFTNVDSWIWQDMSSVPEYLVTASDTLFITAFNLCGQSTDTLIVDALPDIPQLYLGLDTSLCASESLTLSIPFSDVGILWSDQSTQPDFIITAPGTYFGSIENECGISSDTIVVSALPAVPVLQLGPDIPLCPGQMIEIDPGIADVQYVWQDGSTMPVYQTDQAGIIILEISNACGVSTDTLEVFISTDGPMLDLGPDLTACEGETVAIESQISGVAYEWQDGSTGPDFLTTQSGTFILMVSNACGTDTDTVIVTIAGQIPAVELGVDTTICEGEILVLQLQSATGSSISWQDGSAEDFFEVSMAGMYAVTVSNQCGSDADTIQVSLTPLPEEFTLGPDQEICEGDTIELTIPAGIVDPYQWSTGENNASISVTQTGTYSLTTSNACGTAEDAVMVQVISESIVFPPDDVWLWCPGDNVTLSALQSIAASYEWNTGATTSQITVSTPDVYSVTVFTTCETAQHVYEVLEEADCFPAPEIYVPNIISPNGDQINDVFWIIPDRDTEILSVEGSIYDRWGNLVFHSQEHPFIWDGTFSGEPMMPGVYVYSINITYIENGQQSVQSLVGNVTVIR